MEKERVREMTERGRRERTTGEGRRWATHSERGRERKKKRREGRGTTTLPMPS